MSYTNKTEFYEIPLPIGSDLYNPMDYNESMEAVDTALHTSVTNASTAVDTANSAAETASEVATGLEALSGTVNEEKGKLTALTARVTAAENEIDDVRADSNDMICAYNEPTATSTHAYSIGDYFIYNNVLYRATAAISVGNTIVPNTNCEATNVTSEFTYSGKVTVDATGKTIGQVLNQIFASLDLTKIRLGKSRLEIDGIRNYVVTQNTANVVSFMSFAATDTYIYGYMAQNSSVCIYYTFSNATATDKTNESAGTGSFTFYY